MSDSPKCPDCGGPLAYDPGEPAEDDLPALDPAWICAGCAVAREIDDSGAIAGRVAESADLPDFGDGLDGWPVVSAPDDDDRDEIQPGDYYLFRPRGAVDR